MEKKYKLTEETTGIYGRILHRIEALKDFGNVKKGDRAVSLRMRKTYLNIGIAGYMVTQKYVRMH